MLKTHETSFAIIQRLSDSIVTALSWLLAYYIRFNYMPGGEVGLLSFFLKLTPVIVLFNYYFFRKNGLYNSQRFNSRYNEIGAVIKANSIAFLAFVIGLYFFAPDRLSRITLINYFFISNFLLILLRITVRNFLRTLRKKGFNLRHILLVGDGPQLLNYIEKVKQFKDAGIYLSGWIDGESINQTTNIPNLSETLDNYLKNHHPDAVVIGYPSKKFEVVENLLKKYHNELHNIQVLPDLSYSFIGHEISEFAGIPLITINQPKITNFDVVTKRIFDFTLSFIGLLIISPLLLLIGFWVKITSPGPIFYGQERMGLDGQSFKMWKFRSMKMDAEENSGAVWTVENDPRRTKFGTFIRATSIDELPQIFNVLVGDMSLVGPRPERPVFVEKFKSEIPAYMLRHRMKAGITGWAQVNGWRGNTSLEKRIECDIYYIKNWSLGLDIKILVMTIYRGFINKNAY